MNGYTFRVNDPYTGKVNTVLVFATDEYAARSTMHTASVEVNGPGLEVHFELVNTTQLRLAA